MKRYIWVLIFTALCNLGAGAVAPELLVDRSDISQPRHINDRIKQDLSQLIRKHSLKKIHLNSEVGDKEATQFAAEIQNYLNSLSIEVETNVMKSRNPVQGIGVAVKGQVAYLTISNRYY